MAPRVRMRWRGARPVAAAVLAAAVLAAAVLAAAPVRTAAAQQGDALADRARRLAAIVRGYQSAADSLALPAPAVPPDDRAVARAQLKFETARQLRALVLAHSADTVARDAMLFHLDRLRNDESSARYYDLLAQYHARSEALAPVAASRFATERFLAAVAAHNIVPQLRGEAAVRLARRRADAEDWPTVDSIARALYLGTQLEAYRPIALDLMFQQGLRVGRRLPALGGPDILEGRRTLAVQPGVVTLIVFWAGWCAPCVRDIPAERALLARYRGRPFAIIGVNADRTVNDARAAVRELKVPWPSINNVDPDGAAGTRTGRWGVRILPTTFVVDDDLVIRRVHRSAEPDSALAPLIEQLVRAAEGRRGAGLKRVGGA